MIFATTDLLVQRPNRSTILAPDIRRDRHSVSAATLAGHLVLSLGDRWDGERSQLRLQGPEGWESAVSSSPFPLQAKKAETRPARPTSADPLLGFAALCCACCAVHDGRSVCLPNSTRPLSAYCPSAPGRLEDDRAGKKNVAEDEPQQSGR